MPKKKEQLFNKGIELADGSYIVFDLETTGQDPLEAKIIQIAAQKIKNNQLTEAFESYVKDEPGEDGRYVPKEIEELTHISNETVEKLGRPWAEVEQKFEEFLFKDQKSKSAKPVLVGHNIEGFDLVVLRENNKKYGINNGKIEELNYIDTLKIANEKTWIKHANLKELAKKFGIKEEVEKDSKKGTKAKKDDSSSATTYHNAIYDVKKTARVFAALVNENNLKQENIAEKQSYTIDEGRKIHPDMPELYLFTIGGKKYFGGIATRRMIEKLWVKGISRINIGHKNFGKYVTPDVSTDLSKGYSMRDVRTLSPEEQIQLFNEYKENKIPFLSYVEPAVATMEKLPKEEIMNFSTVGMKYMLNPENKPNTGDEDSDKKLMKWKEDRREEINLLKTGELKPKNQEVFQDNLIKQTDSKKQDEIIQEEAIIENISKGIDKAIQEVESLPEKNIKGGEDPMAKKKKKELSDYNKADIENILKGKTKNVYTLFDEKNIEVSIADSLKDASRIDTDRFKEAEEEARRHGMSLKGQLQKLEKAARDHNMTVLFSWDEQHRKIRFIFAPADTDINKDYLTRNYENLVQGVIGIENKNALAYNGNMQQVNSRYVSKGEGDSIELYSAVEQTINDVIQQVPDISKEVNKKTEEGYKKAKRDVSKVIKKGMEGSTVSVNTTTETVKDGSKVPNQGKNTSMNLKHTASTIDYTPMVEQYVKDLKDLLLEPIFKKRSGGHRLDEAENNPALQLIKDQIIQELNNYAQLTLFKSASGQPFAMTKEQLDQSSYLKFFKDKNGNFIINNSMQDVIKSIDLPDDEKEKLIKDYEEKRGEYIRAMGKIVGSGENTYGNRTLGSTVETSYSKNRITFWNPSQVGFWKGKTQPGGYRGDAQQLNLYAKTDETEEERQKLRDEGILIDAIQTQAEKDAGEAPDDYYRVAYTTGDALDLTNKLLREESEKKYTGKSKKVRDWENRTRSRLETKAKYKKAKELWEEKEGEDWYKNHKKEEIMNLTLGEKEKDQIEKDLKRKRQEAIEKDYAKKKINTGAWEGGTAVKKSAMASFNSGERVSPTFKEEDLKKDIDRDFENFLKTGKSKNFFTEELLTSIGVDEETLGILKDPKKIKELSDEKREKLKEKVKTKLDDAFADDAKLNKEDPNSETFIQKYIRERKLKIKDPAKAELGFFRDDKGYHAEYMKEHKMHRNSKLMLKDFGERTTANSIEDRSFEINLLLSRAKDTNAMYNALQEKNLNTKEAVDLYNSTHNDKINYEEIQKTMISLQNIDKEKGRQFGPHLDMLMSSFIYSEGMEAEQIAGKAEELNNLFKAHQEEMNKRYGLDKKLQDLYIKDEKTGKYFLNDKADTNIFKKADGTAVSDEKAEAMIKEWEKANLSKFDEKQREEWNNYSLAEKISHVTGDEDFRLLQEFLVKFALEGSEDMKNAITYDYEEKAWMIDKTKLTWLSRAFMAFDPEYSTKVKGSWRREEAMANTSLGAKAYANKNIENEAERKKAIENIEAVDEYNARNINASEEQKQKLAARQENAKRQQSKAFELGKQGKGVEEFKDEAVIIGGDHNNIDLTSPDLIYSFEAEMYDSSGKVKDEFYQKSIWAVIDKKREEIAGNLGKTKEEIPVLIDPGFKDGIKITSPYGKQKSVIANYIPLTNFEMIGKEGAEKGAREEIERNLLAKEQGETLGENEATSWMNVNSSQSKITSMIYRVAKKQNVSKEAAAELFTAQRNAVEHKDSFLYKQGTERVQAASTYIKPAAGNLGEQGTAVIASRKQMETLYDRGLNSEENQSKSEIQKYLDAIKGIWLDIEDLYYTDNNEVIDEISNGVWSKIRKKTGINTIDDLDDISKWESEDPNTQQKNIKTLRNAYSQFRAFLLSSATLGSKLMTRRTTAVEKGANFKPGSKNKDAYEKIHNIYSEEGKRVRGLQSIVERHPEFGGLDAKHVNTFIANPENEPGENSLILGYAIAKFLNADYDADRIGFSLHFGGDSGGMTTDQLRKARAGGRFETTLEQQKNSVIEDIIRKRFHKGSEKTKISKKEIQDWLNPKSQFDQDNAARYNKSMTGIIANKGQAINHFIASVAGNLDNEGLLGAIATRGLFETFTQESLSSKKIAERLKGADKEKRAEIWNEAQALIAQLTDPENWKDKKKMTELLEAGKKAGILDEGVPMVERDALEYIIQASQMYQKDIKAGNYKNFAKAIGLSEEQAAGYAITFNEDGTTKYGADLEKGMKDPSHLKLFAGFDQFAQILYNAQENLKRAAERSGYKDYDLKNFTIGGKASETNNINGNKVYNNYQIVKENEQVALSNKQVEEAITRTNIALSNQEMGIENLIPALQKLIETFKELGSYSSEAAQGLNIEREGELAKIPVAEEEKVKIDELGKAYTSMAKAVQPNLNNGEDENSLKLANPTTILQWLFHPNAGDKFNNLDEAMKLFEEAKDKRLGKKDKDGNIITPAEDPTYSLETKYGKKGEAGEKEFREFLKVFEAAQAGHWSEDLIAEFGKQRGKIDDKNNPVVQKIMEELRAVYTEEHAQEMYKRLKAEAKNTYQNQLKFLTDKKGIGMSQEDAANSLANQMNQTAVGYSFDDTKNGEIYSFGLTDSILKGKEANEWIIQDYKRHEKLTPEKAAHVMMQTALYKRYLNEFMQDYKVNGGDKNLIAEGMKDEDAQEKLLNFIDKIPELHKYKTLFRNFDGYSADFLRSLVSGQATFSTVGTITNTGKNATQFLQLKDMAVIEKFVDEIVSKLKAGEEGLDANYGAKILPDIINAVKGVLPEVDYIMDEEDQQEGSDLKVSEYKKKMKTIESLRLKEAQLDANDPTEKALKEKLQEQIQLLTNQTKDFDKGNLTTEENNELEIKKLETNKKILDLLHKEYLRKKKDGEDIEKDTDLQRRISKALGKRRTSNVYKNTINQWEEEYKNGESTPSDAKEKAAIKQGEALYKQRARYEAELARNRNEQKMSFDPNSKIYLKNQRDMIEEQLRLTQENINNFLDNTILTDAQKKKLEENYKILLGRKLADEDVRNKGQNTFWGQLGVQITNVFTRFMKFGAVNKVMQVFRRSLQHIITSVKQLDKVMTNLRIVTGKGLGEAQKYIGQYSKLAEELGVTTTQLMESTNEWLRQGYDAAEVNKLVTASMHLSKLGMISTQEATKDLIIRSAK